MSGSKSPASAPVNKPKSKKKGINWGKVLGHTVLAGAPVLLASIKTSDPRVMGAISVVSSLISLFSASPAQPAAPAPIPAGGIAGQEEPSSSGS